MIINVVGNINTTGNSTIIMNRLVQAYAEITPIKKPKMVEESKVDTASNNVSLLISDLDIPIALV
jgi:hypothetical protein